MIIRSAFAALRQVLSPGLRRIALRSVGMTLILILAVWAILTKGFGYLLEKHPLSLDYPVVDGFVYFMAGAGLIVALLYLLPAISALVGGFFLDDAAVIVEATDFPGDPPGQAMSTGSSIGYGLRFALLALVVNLAALALFFIPVVNIGAFFVANAYLLGREYFEMAAARFRPVRDAARLRRENRLLIMAAGSVLAGLMLIPVFNLLTPIFGIALMVHVHKHVAGRTALAPPARP
ncbi:sulfate transporter family protein [uncultured Enterovirga sp.]|uniref:sulfate transporter family protein n=1 Tax=uncultured Enterovirga sp. TaxID=2026352 RepID=UPI0035CAFCEF